MTAFIPGVETKTHLQQSNCGWQLIDTSESTSNSNDERLSASINGTTINTSYSIPASEFCGAQEFTTHHSWTEPFSVLTPGNNITFSVEASWALNGSSDCSSLSAGLDTWVTAGATNITARRDKVIVAVESSGSVSNSGSWIVPSASTEGEIMTIKAGGGQGGAGGSVTYKYQYGCTIPAMAANETKIPGSCYPNVSNISNLTPGTILSPSVDFVDENGAPVAIIGLAWFINGVQTSSATWDGKQTTLELQYTCPDHIGHVLSMTIPASGTIQQPIQPSNQIIPPITPPQTPPQSPPPGTSLTDLIKTILIGFGVIAVVTTSVVVAGKVIKSGKSTKPVAPVEEAKPVVKKPKLSEKDRSFLMTRRSLLDAKWNEIRKEIITREKQHLKVIRLNTSNRFKSMFLKGIEVKGAISGPIGKIVGEGFKKATGVDIDKMLFDLDNARDVDILIKGKQAQANLKEYITQLKQDLKSTAREINKIDAQLAEPG